MIYILTGDIRTGKTTGLLDWIKNRDDVNGLLCPDDDNGKRYFLKIKSKETFSLEVESEIESDKIVTIGPFQFMKSAFTQANDFLMSFTSEMESQYLIIDELGKLELKNLGLHLAAKTLIPNYSFSDEHHLILVIRGSLLNAVIEHYDIKSYLLITKENLTKDGFT